MIQTVTGVLEGKNIRRTLSHEHLVFGKPGYCQDADNPYQRDTARKNIRAMLDLVKPYDVDLLVDATTIEWGRDPLLMREAAQEYGIGIVCCTGFFKDEGDMLAWLKAISYTCDLTSWLADLFTDEILHGIGDTGIRAGAIKAASSYGEIKPLERTILCAAAKAQQRTGVPVLTHCDRGTMASQQLELLVANGVPADKIIIGHMTSNRDWLEIKRITEKGATVAFDQFGILSIPDIPTDEEKMENLLALLKNGCEDHIVLSHDCCFDRMGYVSKSKPRYPDMVFKTVVPYLVQNGISQRTIQKITRDNLLRVFGA